LFRAALLPEPQAAIAGALTISQREGSKSLRSGMLWTPLSLLRQADGSHSSLNPAAKERTMSPTNTATHAPADLPEFRERLEEIARDPWWPPDWRWRLLTENPGAGEILQDRALQAAARWRARGCAASANYRLAAARRVSLAGPDDPQRAELEARVLAGQSARVIGSRVMLAPKAVKAYRAIWFDLRTRLENRTLIHQWIVQIDRLSEGRSLSSGWLWRAAGYAAGSQVLEELVMAYRMLTTDQRNQGVAGYIAPDALTPRVLQGWIAECVPEQPQNGEPVLRGPLYEHSRASHAYPLAASDEIDSRQAALNL